MLRRSEYPDGIFRVDVHFRANQFIDGLLSVERIYMMHLAATVLGLGYFVNYDNRQFCSYNRVKICCRGISVFAIVNY